MLLSASESFLNSYRRVISERMSKGRKFLYLSIVILTAEKTIQHLVLALFFTKLFPSTGTPDIGPNFSIDSYTMVLLNLFYALLFGIGLFGQIRKTRWGLSFIIALAAIDIFLEFIFHGFFYITVSVLMSTALIIAGALYTRKRRKSAVAC
jgi:hypothetical protein